MSGNGQRNGIINSVTTLAQSLPGQFLALLVLNVVFLGGVLWFLDGVLGRYSTIEAAEIKARAEIIGPLLTKCIDNVGDHDGHVRSQ